METDTGRSVDGHRAIICDLLATRNVLEGPIQLANEAYCSTNGVSRKRNDRRDAHTMSHTDLLFLQLIYPNLSFRKCDIVDSEVSYARIDNRTVWEYPANCSRLQPSYILDTANSLVSVRRKMKTIE